MTDPRADIVARQYEEWTYPEPIIDLEQYLVNNWQKFDPSHAHRLIWPDREYKPDLQILIGGCGTNQAAIIAYNNRNARVVAVDVSQSSLDHEEYLKEKYELHNLELHRLPIEDVPTLELDFDYVIATGVLHHMADPSVGVNALAECLREDGVLGLMLYSTYGRVGIHILQSVFRDLELGQDSESVGVVRNAIASLPPHHLARGYLDISSDWHYDAGLVDTFLHGRERTYTVEDCIEFVESAGLVFQTWLDKSPYYLHEIADPMNVLHPVLKDLPEQKVWSVVDRLRTLNACHLFMACRPGRPSESYAIDFSTPEALAYVPQFRMGCGLSGAEIYRPDWRFGLNPTQLAFARLADGQRTIGQIAKDARQGGELVHGGRTKAEDRARELFQAFWRLDFLAMAFGAPAT